MSFLVSSMVGDTILPMLVSAIVSGYLVYRHYRNDNQARHEELKRIKQDVAQAQSLEELKKKLAFKDWR